MASRSNLACLACKKHKRRCDKALPECSLCRRTSRQCVYGEARGSSPTAGDWISLQSRLAELESRLSTSRPPSSTEQQPSPFTESTPSSNTELTSGTTLCDSTSDVHVPGSSIAASSHGSVVGLTPAYSAVDDHPPYPYAESQFPASMFLDIDCFVWSGVRMPPPSDVIPAPVLAILSQGTFVVDVSQTYFATVHTWLPMVSKKRMELGLPVQNAGPDLAMLFLGMRLVTTSATDADGMSLYRTAKGFLAHLEGNGTVSLLTLQAMILIALYEYGHAIYPAAWMSVGSCARYCDLLGLTSGDYAVLGQPSTWTEAEERRRVWWSVFILDKIVAMGSRRRCLVPEPQPEGRLPVNDEAWDGGEVSKAAAHSTSTPYQVGQSGFPRLCQAAIYLGRAIGHARSGSTCSPSRATEIMTLAHDLTGFTVAVDNEGSACSKDQSFSFLSSRAIARSALYIALDRFTCPEKVSSEPGYADQNTVKSQRELELQMQAVQSIEAASEQVHTLAMSIMAAIRTGTEEDAAQPSVLERVSPFIMDSLYAAAATFHWLVGENGKETYRQAAADLGMLLDTLSLKWRIGNAYRELLMAYDVTARVDARMMI